MLHKISLYRKISFIVLAIIIGICCSKPLQAQDPIFSQFMFNQLYFNPAFAGNTPYPRLISGYRNQWPGIGNAYVSYYASYDQYVDALEGGLGLGLTRDVQGGGIFSKTSFDVMYSYPIEFSYDIAGNLGLQASIAQNSFNSSDVVLGDQNPYLPLVSPEIIPSQSKIYADFSAGVSFLYKEQYQINISVNHINKPNEMTGSSYIYYHMPMRFTVQIMGQYPSKRTTRNVQKVIFKPGIMTQIQKTNNFFGWGSNILISSFTGGLWFRNDASLTLNSVIALAGYSQSGFSIYYSYDFWFPKNYQHVKNYGAHEVTFIYLFQYNDPRKKMRTIKCPKF